MDNAWVAGYRSYSCAGVLPTDCLAISSGGPNTISSLLWPRGLTQETAVVISGAKGLVDGVPAEHAWLEVTLLAGSDIHSLSSRGSIS